MKTSLLLMAQYEKTVIPLEEICEEYFGCKMETARGKAKSSTLPVPAFQMTESQKGPFFVHLEDLANWIDKCREEARSDWAAF